ncbi:uncharacterized protein LOC114306924 [Camellia sinensis]|uniref:uncharacterized protein LOC114306924 n=1 Tax=Camellia sinensis TaxID=4442 RepID=UPI0010369FFC|nr:uncharacterized protein LOC114306924 [Camellia sinensis]
MESQKYDQEVVFIKIRTASGDPIPDWMIHSDESLRHQGRVFMPQDEPLKEKVLKEFHHSMFIVHPGGTKIQSELTIQTLEDMLRACVMNFKWSWERHLPLVEFTYSNSFQANVGMAPLEALYSWPYRLPVCWTEVREVSLWGPKIVQETIEKVKLIR